MSLKLVKQDSGTVSTPDSSHVAFFVDTNGNPTLKDSEGVVTPATNTGGPVQLNEQVSAPAPAANAIKLYAKEVSSQTELFAIDGFGNEVQITSGGSVFGAPSIDWKNGTPGNPYIAGDTVTATHNSIVMVDVANPDDVTVNLPAITSASAGRVIGIRNLHSKKDGPGAVIVVPDAADTVETFGVGVSIRNDEDNIHSHLESDGVGRWNLTIFGSGPSIWEEA